MSTITHQRCRTAVASGDLDEAVSEHLEACTPCAAFARRVRRITVTAPSLAPGAEPAGLADSVLAALRPSDPVVAPVPLPLDAGPAGAAAPATRSLAARAGRRVVFAAAAAVAVLAAATLVGGPERDPGRPVLVAAAEKAEQAGGARVRVHVDVDVSVAVPKAGMVDVDGVPTELGDYLASQYDRMNAEFERRMREWQRQVDEMLDGAVPEIPPVPGVPGVPQPPRMPSIPRLPTSLPSLPSIPKPPPLPEKLTMGVEATVDGRVDFDGGARLSGEVRTRSGTVALPATSVAVDVAVEGRGGAVRANHGTWVSLGGAHGPLGSVLLDASLLPRLLRAGADAALHAETEAGGTRVRHYRFPMTGLAGPGVTSTVDAYVGADGDLVRVTVSSGGGAAGTTWKTFVDVRVLGFGGAEVEEPLPATGASAEVATFLYPFGPAISVAVGGRPS